MVDTLVLSNSLLPHFSRHLTTLV